MFLPSEILATEGELMLAKHARAAALAFFMLPFAWASQICPAFAATVTTDKPVVEVDFVLDTTGSMGPLIESVKRKIWSIATAIVDANPEAQIRMQGKKGPTRTADSFDRAVEETLRVQIKR
jgi:hypothetical protein